MSRNIDNEKFGLDFSEESKKELEALIIDRGKVTRTTQLKDGADVLVGSIYNAQMNYVDVPQYEYYDRIEQVTSLDYNKFINTESEELIDL